MADIAIKLINLDLKTNTKPKVELILTQSLDGFIAKKNLESKQDREALGLTGAVDFVHMQERVSNCQVVFFGERSLQAERGAFRTTPQPMWVIFGTKDQPLPHAFWQQKGIEKKYISRVGFGADGDVDKNIFVYLSELHQQGVRRIALLGGAALAQRFFAAGLIDFVTLSVAPVILGDGVKGFLPNEFTIDTGWKMIKSEEKEGFQFITYEKI